TLAYQGHGRGLALDALTALHRFALGAFAPDLTLILDLPVEIGLARAAARPAAADRFERLDRAFHERLRQGFRRIAAEESARCVEELPERASAVPSPRANPDLVGHEDAERELRRLDEIGRLPHAILLSGPRGIGKATLAFRLARFLLATNGERSGRAEGGLAI